MNALLQTAGILQDRSLAALLQSFMGAIIITACIVKLIILLHVQQGVVYAEGRGIYGTITTLVTELLRKCTSFLMLYFRPEIATRDAVTFGPRVEIQSQVQDSNLCICKLHKKNNAAVCTVQ